MAIPDAKVITEARNTKSTIRGHFAIVDSTAIPCNRDRVLPCFDAGNRADRQAAAHVVAMTIVSDADDATVQTQATRAKVMPVIGSQHWYFPSRFGDLYGVSALLDRTITITEPEPNDYPSGKTVQVGVRCMVLLCLCDFMVIFDKPCDFVRFGS